MTVAPPAVRRAAPSSAAPSSAASAAALGGVAERQDRAVAGRAAARRVGAGGAGPSVRAAALLGVLLGVGAPLGVPAAAQDAAVVDSLERALRAVRADTARAAALVGLALQFNYTDPDRAERYARRAVAAADRSGDPLYRTRAVSALADATWDLDRALEVNVRARAVARTVPDPVERGTWTARLLKASGGIYLMQGDYPRATRFTERAAATFAALGDPRGQADALVNLASIYRGVGRPADALRVHRRADAALAQTGPDARRLVVLNASGRGHVLRDIGDPAGAAEQHLYALRLAERHGMKKDAATALLALHGLALERGDVARARAYARRARGEFEALGDEHSRLAVRLAEAETELRAGAPLRAAAVYRAVAAEARADGRGSEEVRALRGLGRALAEGGRPRAAAAPLRRAVRLARSGEAQVVLPSLLTALARAERAAGAGAEALGYAREAVAAAAETGDLRALADARAALADALVDTGDVGAAYAERVRYDALRDSLAAREQADALADAEVRYDVGRRTRQAEAARSRAQIAELRVGRQRAWLAGGAAALALLAALAAALWRTARLRRRANRLLAERAAEVERGRAEAERALARTEHLLGEREVLLREVHHRVKNNLQVVASLVNLQGDAVADEEARAALRQMRARVDAMALVHRRLYGGDDLRTVDAADYLGDLAGLLEGTYARADVDLAADLDPVALDADTAVPLGLAAAELVANAFEHGVPTGGHVRLSLVGRPGGRLVLAVEDSGPGLPPGLAAPPDGSLGLQLASDLALQLGGRLETGRSAALGGARLALDVPYAAPPTGGGAVGGGAVGGGAVGGGAAGGGAAGGGAAGDGAVGHGGAGVPVPAAPGVDAA